MPIKNHQQLRGKPDLSKETHSFQYQNYYGAVSHMCGWRKTMEDTDICQFNINGKGAHLFGIFDGHGGAEIAIYAKRHLKRVLLANPHFIEEDYQSALQQIFPDLDAQMKSQEGFDELFDIKDEIQQKLKKQYKFDWQEDSDDQVHCLAGSTAQVCLIIDDAIYIASLGDSRCMISSDKQFTHLSIDHKPELPQQKLRIQKAGGKVKNNRINGMLGMSRSLGDFQFKMKKGKKPHQQMVISLPHIDKIKNQKVQYILLGCDGIWQGHDNDWYFNIIHEKLQNNETPAEIIHYILDNVVAKTLDGDEGHDNMTAILINEFISKIENQDQKGSLQAIIKLYQKAKIKPNYV